MIEKMSESEGKVLGFKAVGTVTKEDYKVLVPEVKSIVDKEGSISMLLDLRQFKWENIDAWMADINFSRAYHQKIDKMAIVGDKNWEKWITALAKPFYSKKARFFYLEDIDSAWKWLKE